MTKTLSFLLAMVICMAGAAAWAATLEVQAPMVRMVPPGQSVSAAFMVLHNHGMSERSLVAAHSDVADAVELHNHIMEDGMMKMRRLDAIAIPGHGQAVLQPGGFHIMLIGLSRSLEMGEQVLIELEFADGERLAVDAVVQMAGVGQDHSDHSSHGD
ncbi:MAG: copper chaperone PCu(A)C [Arenicellales bacterium]|nr:copper chaperone PCu(A)C [Arenicellales bacterium]MDP6791683.1 copper chaperone PCu(A)C [Arenicellales bacterium]MDP6918628.1 copper chaperone PCu(A)C [Arenicellales bacterium]